MNLSEIFIRKPVMTVLVTVFVLILGTGAFFKMPVSDLPTVDYPVMTLSVTYPGASPETMASVVAAPLENELMQIPGLERMISDNTENTTKITLTFDLDRSVDLAAPDVQAAIQRAMGNLPTDLPAPPTYDKSNPSDKPIIHIMTYSDTLTKGELYDYANKRIAQRISTIEGISKVEVWGAKTAVRIQADSVKLAAYGIGMDEVAAALAAGTVSIPAGAINGRYKTFSIEPQGQLLKAADYKSLIVAYRNNAPVYLRDLATCVDSVDDDVLKVMYGSPETGMKDCCVHIAVYRAAGTNTVSLAADIDALLGTLRKEIPSSIYIVKLYDKSITIIESINDVKTTILIALMLVVLVIFLFIGRLSETVIPSVTLPISIIATFLVMYLAGFSLDTLSMMGLTLAVGFVVDDAIVVLENTIRRTERGEKAMAAAIGSAKEIKGTIVSMTLSLSVVFVPLIFMGGVVGRTFREFSITVVAAILCSGIVSLTLTPMMCARMLRVGAAKKNRMETFVDTFMGRLVATYGTSLKFCLRHKAIGVVAWILCLAGTLLLFRIIPKSFLPEGDSGLVMGQYQVPLGTSTEQMVKFQEKIADFLLHYPETQRFATVTGQQTGADQSTGVFYVHLKDKRKKSIHEVVGDFRMNFAKFADGMVFPIAVPALKISTGGESTASGNQYSYLLRGTDRDALYAYASKLAETMKTLPGFIDVQNSVKLNFPQLELRMKRDRMSSLGISAADVERTLCQAYAGGKVTTFKTDIDQYDVILELAKSEQRRPEDLAGIYVKSKITGALVPLGSLVESRETVGPQDVPHFDQMDCATLSFNLVPGMPIGTATATLEKAVADIVPPEIEGEFQGEAQEFKDAIRSLALLILIAVFIKYCILGVLYESYVHPFTVLTTLPVGCFGGLLTLLIFKCELSLYAYVGIFMLIGIVAKNGIMMVDFANQNLMNQRGKLSSLDAIYDASIVRFRPILMTGLAAIMGALPIALGYGADGTSRRPLGLIVVGGMVFSQVITLYVTPVIFIYMEKLQEGFLDRFELTRSQAARKNLEAG